MISPAQIRRRSPRRRPGRPCFAASRRPRWPRPSSTADPPASGISQEQALALVRPARRAGEAQRGAEAQITRPQGPVVSGDKAIREEPTQPRSRSATAGRRSPRRTASSPPRSAASFQLDAAHYDQRQPGPLATDFRRGSWATPPRPTAPATWPTATNFRRARLGIEGKAFGDWNYNFLYDFGGSGVEEPGKITQAWVRVRRLPPCRVRDRRLRAAHGPGGRDLHQRLAVPGARRGRRKLVRGLAAGDGRTALRSTPTASAGTLRRRDRRHRRRPRPSTNSWPSSAARRSCRRRAGRPRPRGR